MTLSLMHQRKKSSRVISFLSFVAIAIISDRCLKKKEKTLAYTCVKKILLKQKRSFDSKSGKSGFCCEFTDENAQVGAFVA